MAILVPDMEDINDLPQGVMEGERALLNILLETLDDEWTIYFQPHLNGLNPDIVIFSENAGIGVFEVKDWHLNNYKIINSTENNS